MTVKEVLHTTEDKLKKSLEFVQRNFAEVRTGRANPAIVEGLHIDYYGTPTMLKQLASISVPDAHMLGIQPWDQTAIPEIEKAILKSNLGITPAVDGKMVRLSVPQLSKERRQELVKVVHKMAEEGRVSLRTVRHESKALLEKLEKDKAVTEDDKFRGLDEIQKMVERYGNKIEEMLKTKEKEVLEL
ncbi:MAG TPA: ribosome recycling factor [Candidatus Omnitrophota bacterium]|nr:ribosome recycling factor [Candidatus Omnitrophota bacterium]